MVENTGLRVMVTFRRNLPVQKLLGEGGIDTMGKHAKNLFHAHIHKILEHIYYKFECKHLIAI
jgi:hypothetical protein